MSEDKTLGLSSEIFTSSVKIVQDASSQKGKQMKILIAIDSFKGSLSSLEAGNAVKEGLKALAGETDEVVVKPIADGGEGSVVALADALNGEFIDVIVQNPLGEKIPARYALAGELGILEMASSSGLMLVEKERRNPMKTSTYGFGQMILHAISKGARKFIVGIGKMLAYIAKSSCSQYRVDERVDSYVAVRVSL